MSLRINYKTPEAVRAIHNLKVSVKNNKWNFEKMITKSSPELRSKRKYMQSSAFLNDEHNLKMFELYDKLITARDKIAKAVDFNNKTQLRMQVQGINGFARIKEFLDKNPKLHFWETPSITDSVNNEYKIARIQIYNHARNYKSKIGR